MPRVGTDDLYTSADGWIEIDFYDPGDFAFEPIEMYLSSGVWGVPYLRNPAEADTPIEVYTSANGWMGVNSAGWIYIEDFETGDLSRWYTSTDPTTGANTTAAIIGDYGVTLADEEDQSEYTQRIYSHPNEGMTALPYYPEYNDEWEFFWQPTTGADSEGHHRVAFGVADQNVSDNFGPITTDFSSDFDNWLAFDIQPAVSEIHIWKKINGTRTERTTETFNPSAGTTYRCVIDWGSSSADTITVDVYEYNPSGDDTIIVSTTDTHSDYSTTRRGVFVESELTASESHYDALRKYPGT